MKPTAALFFNSKQVRATIAELEGDPNLLSQQLLATWATEGLVTPSVQKAVRRTQPALYNLSDLRRIWLVVRMRRAGISMPRVRVLLVHLDARHPEVFRPSTRAVLRITRWNVSVEQPGGPTTTAEGQLCLALEPERMKTLSGTARRLLAQRGWDRRRLAG